MRILGSYTSPYVRRVRIVLDRLGVSFEMVDTATEDGQAELRTASPLWKVPVLDTQGEGVIADSRIINDWLLSRHPSASIRPYRDALLEQQQIAFIDGALDALINVFYLRREGASPAAQPYLQKQLDRAEATLEHVAASVDDGYFTSDRRVGMVEIALVTALDWFAARSTWDVSKQPSFVRFLEVHAEDASFLRTRPPAT